MTEHGSRTCPPRWATRRNPDRPTLGPAAARLAEDLGLVLMPHQREVLDVALELDPATGTPWYRDVGVSAGRQTGKSTLILPVAVHRCVTYEALGWGTRPLLKLLAQNALMARRKLLDDYWPRIGASPRIKRQAAKPVRSAGREAIVWTNGARFETGGNHRDANHGLTIHAAFLDEAFAYGPDGDEEASVRPAMSTVLAAQQWTLSAAGDGEADWWNSYQDEARAIVDSHLDARRAYFEWGAHDDVDLDDQALWPTFMPGLAAGIIPLEVVRTDHDKLSPGQFARAYGNRRTGAREVLFPRARWGACGTDLAPLEQLQLAVDVSFPAEGASRRTAIAVAGWNAGVPVVEVIDDREGTGWVRDRLRQLISDHRPVGVVCDDRGPVAAIHRDLRAVVPASRLTMLGTGDVCAAAETFHQAVLEGRVRHRRQTVLDLAVDGCKRRPVVDAWAFGRRQSNANVAPLVAVSLAHARLLARGHALTDMI